jgi:hypothetical protein
MSDVQWDKDGNFQLADARVLGLQPFFHAKLKFSVDCLALAAHVNESIWILID